MKTKKLLPLVFIAVFACFTNQSHAQISAGANLGFFKILEDGSDAQFGFNLTGKYALTENIKVGANLGYYVKSYEYWGTTMKSSIMPFMALAEYGFSIDKIKPYVGADVGIYRIAVHAGGSTEGNSYFGFAPVVGCNYELTSKIWLNANMKFHVITGDISTNAFGLLIGAIYNL